MQWNKAKDSNLDFDWVCETPYWSFRIIKMDEDNYVLYNTKPFKKVLRISKDINDLQYYAFDLNLSYERRQNKEIW